MLYVKHDRMATADCPTGVTISRRQKLPKGDFMITEYSWPWVTLWFVDADKFTADERQEIAEMENMFAEALKD